MNNIRVSGNQLLINNKTITFQLPIYRYEEYEDGVIILLDFQKDVNQNCSFNELYAVSYKGNTLWKMEGVEGKIGNQEPDPLVDFRVQDGNVIAIDYSSRKYIVDIRNGKIKDYYIGRW